ncbi:MAG: Na+/H+ antiporter NhaC family protein [Planctomycetes bacterium]|nr:Na+/H+ antiporter NhaC family protein [Planctomycetota bacterium]MBL7038037.1 Na+/H+ antiporter NhaC family protein [Pirellulaceae bacterium]
MDEHIEFRGGAWTSVVPLVVFIVATGALVIAGAPVVEGMILAAMAGISLGLLLARRPGVYTERVFALMADRTATVAIVAWLWAGTFSGILKDSGLVEAIVWIGAELDVTGAAFTVLVFVSSALFAVTVGTGMGTVLGFTAVMYPAGIVLGADPAAVMGAIISGAALGDNLAPISDTTIVSAATQETDVAGVVRSRLKYVLIAAGLSCVLFALFGGGEAAVDIQKAERLIADTADPAGLPMLIPAAIVFFVAVIGRNFLAALTAGIIAALVIGPLCGVFPLRDVLHVTHEGLVEGSAVDGAMSLIPICILTLLLVTSMGIMADSGFLAQLMAWLDRTVARGVRSAEGTIVAMISFANLCVSVNTVAMITVGPLANRLRKRHQIHPHRSANLMDTISCSFPYILPYSAPIVAAAGIQRTLAKDYEFVQVLSWAQEAPFIFYGLILFPLMIVVVATGYGRKAG